jgi:hypothetical protein
MKLVLLFLLAFLAYTGVALDDNDDLSLVSLEKVGSWLFVLFFFFVSCLLLFVGLGLEYVLFFFCLCVSINALKYLVSQYLKHLKLAHPCPQTHTYT